MALLTINFYSKVLMQEVAVTAILPEKQHGVGIGNSPADEKRVNAAVWDGDTPLKTLYLLHGWSDGWSLCHQYFSILHGCHSFIGRAVLFLVCTPGLKGRFSLMEKKKIRND